MSSPFYCVREGEGPDFTESYFSSFPMLCDFLRLLRATRTPHQVRIIDANGHFTPFEEVTR